MIARELHDPGVGFVTITRVQVSPDLQHARVYYTSLGDAAARKNTARALERAAELHAAADRPAPPPAPGAGSHFEFDESIGHQDRVEQLLQRNRRARQHAPDAPDAPDAPRSLMSAESDRRHPRRHSPAAALRHHLARAARRRCHRLAARHGVRAARARQGRADGRRGSRAAAIPGIPRRPRHSSVADGCTGSSMPRS